MFFFCIIGVVTGKLCLHLSEIEFYECVQTLDRDSCEKAKAELRENVKDCLNAQQISNVQKFFDFTAGFLNGIQKNTTNPSACVVSVINFKSTWANLFNQWTDLNFAAPVMFVFNFNTLVQNIVTTYGVCNFATLYKIFHPGSFPKFLNSIFTHWLVSKDKVTVAIQKISADLSISNYVYAGIDSGRLFTLLTGFQV